MLRPRAPRFLILAFFKDDPPMNGKRKRKLEPTPLERMTDLTRRLVAVPKSEIPAKSKPKRKSKSR